MKRTVRMCQIQTSFLWGLLLCFQTGLYAEEVEKKDPSQLIVALGQTFESIHSFFDKAMVVIIPDASGKVMLGKMTDFSSDSTMFLQNATRIRLDEIGEHLIKQTRGNVEMAYHLFVVARADLPYEVLYDVVNRYQDGLKKFPEHNSLNFHVTLSQSFNSLEELKGFKGAGGKE